MDVTSLGVGLTGDELSLEDLRKLDPRMSNIPSSTVENFQAVFLHEHAGLPCSIPGEVIKRLRVACDLAIYGFFSYEFFGVSLLWSLTTIEMALAHKLFQVFPQPVTLTKKCKEKEFLGNYEMLNDELRDRWRIVGLSEFNGGFRGLMRWARNARLLDPATPVILDIITASFEHEQRKRVLDGQQPQRPSCLLDVLVAGIPSLRNQLAHPREFNWLLPPGVSQRGFLQATCIIGQLWKDSKVTNCSVNDG